MALWSIIMAGGSGTRFWPLSRRERPKQFLPIGTDTPLIVETLKRLDGVIERRNCRVVAGPHHRGHLAECLPDFVDDQFVIEPCPRNTAPCLGLAAIHVAHEDPTAVMAVLPADHHVADVARYQGLIRTAERFAAAGDVVTLGITPSRPETGYGYIKTASRLDMNEEDVSPGYTVERFVEKPDSETARRYVASGDFLWNSGMFFLSVRTLLDTICTYMPDLAEGLDRIAKAIGTPEYQETLDEVFPTLPAISIDYGIMEPLSQTTSGPRVTVLEADIGWNDVGHWGALDDFVAADTDGNVINGNGVMVDAYRNTIHSESAVVACIGVSDLVVVQTEDAILVCPKDRAQNVRAIVDRLKASGKEGLI